MWNCSEMETGTQFHAVFSILDRQGRLSCPEDYFRIGSMLITCCSLASLHGIIKLNLYEKEGADGRQNS